MNEEFSILAASWLGPEGYGNDLTGLRDWPTPLAEQLRGGELDGLHWSLLSDSDPSRFLRMDLMCRLGFMAAELLDAGFDTMSDERRERTGVCVESFTGCLDTDIHFALTPRPSIFAYTLPSTVIGEICIRFRLRGPVLGLVPTAPGGGHGSSEATDWLRRGEAQSVLCLSIEAMNHSTANSMPLPVELSTAGWHAAALLLGRAEGSSRAQPLAAGSLTDIAIACVRAPGRNALAISNRRKIESMLNAMAPPIETLIEELKTKIIAGFRLEGVTTANIDGDAPIFGGGIGLDSIDALELVAILEQDYGIVITERAVANKAFASVRALAEFVAANRA